MDKHMSQVIAKRSRWPSALMRGAVGATIVSVLAVSGMALGADDVSDGAAAEMLTVTPSQAEGPFYPVELPSDRDADLTVIEGSTSVADGVPLQLDGILLTTDGSPVADAVVEIWQTDARGVYLHPDDPGIVGRDDAFQGYGEAVTDAQGAWSFRTILPEVYGGRPRHIHAKVKVDGAPVLTTQIYFAGGDIPDEGAVVRSGADTDALIIEALLVAGADGPKMLHATHRLVLPAPTEG